MDQSKDILVENIDYYLRRMLSICTSHGWDRLNKGLHERLTADHVPLQFQFRRLTVCGRQLFVFSHAACEGLLAGDAKQHAEYIYRYMRDYFWDHTHGGWYNMLDVHGNVFDDRKDLYSHAFALFGLGYYYEQSGDSGVLEFLTATDQVIQNHFALARGWYASRCSRDWSQPDCVLLQNPHMHLFEGYVAAYRATQNVIYRERANDIARLFHARIFETGHGVILEYRTEQGLPDPVRGYIVEPGHHFEWCWLLQTANQTLGGEEIAIASQLSLELFDWGFRNGWDQDEGGIFDEVGWDGTVLSDTKRIWPFTEYVKARAVRFLQTGHSSDRTHMIAGLEFLFRWYLKSDGSWNERLRRDLSCYDSQLPATTCYHILLSLTEARRALLLT
ncbi:N-acylglucosamine 2-epimerase [Nitrospira sp. KM1]|uniref:AGE family epimerase/isomerase n=1 Tax=Nitrospira sp. KM1 TaxID=1936990 RepID=UPI0013A77456|nr:AGE family epimerase/isomerase [Nitrospira sp. KM1]BCA54522.1 N-acylglucosamine 2-epimerase [Nitrospira sp. KM1]